MNNFLVKILDRIFAACGGFLCCQLPAFMQQYMQTLSGHLEESATYVKMIEYNAHLANQTVPGYIQKFLSQNDADFVRQGKMMQDVVNRYDGFASAMTSINEASLWAKPFVFIAKAHMDIIEETYQHFTLSVNFDLETLVYALIGLMIFMGIFRLFIQGIRAIFGSFRKAKVQQHSKSE